MPDFNALLQAVTSKHLMEHVHALTQYIRMPGSDAEKEAFAYLEQALSRCGLNPKRYALPAYISLPVSASLTVAGANIPCTTHSMLPGAALEGDIVSIPDAAAIAGSHSAGKIIMTDGLAMVPTLRAAEAEHALGVIFIAGSRHYHEMIVSPVWGSPEPKDLETYLAIPAVTVSYPDGERIKTLMATTTTATMHTTVETRWMDIPVLTADIGPTDASYLLLSGHVDSWHKGAMDNASGNAAALEIARILSGQAHTLQRGVRIVFWSGHSHGRYAGSTAFCDAFFQDLYDKAFLHINADCLGANGSTLLTQAACMAQTKALGTFAIAAVTGEVLEGVRFGRSCDQSFWGTGTPSLFSSVSEQPKPETDDAASKAFGLMFGGSQSGGYGWWWHTVADTPDKIDPTFLVRDTRIFLAAVHKACTDPRLPLDCVAGFQEFADFVRDYAREAEKELPFGPLLHELTHAEALLAKVDFNALSDDAANAFIMHFQKKLVPLAYVKGPNTGHDAAGPQARIPLLDELPLFMNEKDPHRQQALGVLLRRRLNALTFGVKELAALVQRLL